MRIRRLGSAGLTTVEFLILTVVLGVFLFVALDQLMSSLGAGLLAASAFFLLAVIGEKRKWPAFPAVAVILGVLAGGAVSANLIAKLADNPRSHTARLIRKANEGVTKGNLSEIRGSVKGASLAAVDAPVAKLNPYHPESAAVRLASTPDDAGGWLFDAGSAKVLVNCTHTDTFGSVWTAY